MKTMKTILTVLFAGILWSTAARAADNSALPAPAKSVYGDYLKIQASLAKDSMADVSANASAIVQTVRSNVTTLSPVIATEADAIAKASDLKSARAAFKALSDTLIKYLAVHNAKKAYVEVYCPMANAYWLQADKKVSNPYLGQSMPDCGEIKN